MLSRINNATYTIDIQLCEGAVSHLTATNCYHIPYSNKTLAVKKVWPNKDCRKFGGKNFGKLKSICIWNVMEIIKIGDKLGKML